MSLSKDANPRETVFYAKISEYQIPNDQKSLYDQKDVRWTVVTTIFFQKYHNSNFTIKLILKFKGYS